MQDTTDPISDRAEQNRRGLLLVLAVVLLGAATLIAHAIRPGSLLSDWPSKTPWIPIAIVLFVTIYATTQRGRLSAAETKDVMERVMEDEFRQKNLSRAQRCALVAVLLAQIPLLALSLSVLTTAAAVSVMAVATVTIGITTLIVAFLIFDRE
jgi:hypothetical protein